MAGKRLLAADRAWKKTACVQIALGISFLISTCVEVSAQSTSDGIEEVITQLRHEGDEIEQGGMPSALDGDTTEHERLTDRFWSSRSLIRTGWDWTSGTGYSEQTGGPQGWQFRLSMVGSKGRLGLVLDKDRGEPWGGGTTPWSGPEMKRLFAGLETARFHLIIGSFRIQHGFGLTSGRRMGSLPGATNPLYLPASLASARGYAGTSAGAVRTGALAGLRAERASLRVWQSRDRVTAGLGTAFRDTAYSTTAVTDLSSTGAFTSERSLYRRNGLLLTSTGVQAAIHGSNLGVALISEHVRSTSRGAIRTDHIPTLIPSSLLSGGLVVTLGSRPFYLVHEIALNDKGSFSRQTGLRWRKGSGSGVMIGQKVARGTTANPYSELGRYFSGSSFEKEVHAAGRLIFRGGTAWTIRFSKQRRARGDIRPSTSRWAVDWSLPLGSTRSVMGSRLHLRAMRIESDPSEAETKRTHRMGLRWTLPSKGRWVVSSQVQAGFSSIGTEKASSSRLAALTLDIPGRQTGGWPGRPDWSAMILLRQRHGSGTILYAAKPTHLGGFPVVSGSSPLLSIMHRLRWHPWPHAVGEVVVRLDRRNDQHPSFSARIRAQMQVRL